MHSFLVTTFSLIVLAVSVIALLQWLISPRRDPREPPYLPTSTPIFGHLFGVLGQGADYYRLMDEKHPGVGLYGLPMLNGRMYIVSSAEWATALEKRSNRSVSLELMIVDVIGKVFCFDEKTVAILKDNLFGEDGSRPNLTMENHKLIHGSLAPGDELEELKERTLDNVSRQVNTLAQAVDADEVTVLGLWSWIKEHLSQSALQAFYGPDSPVTSDSALMKDFWVWEENIQVLMMSPAPSILARDAYLARERWLRAWEKYVQEGRYKGASKFIQDRANLHMKEFGLTQEAYGRAESGTPHALLVNMVPSSFWFISYIFQDPALLADIRQELDRCVTRKGNRYEISVSKLRTSCPLFGSTFKETLRIVAPLHTNRVIAEDTLVTNPSDGQTCLIKKGATIQYASTLIHRNESVWGNDANDFQPRRFLPMFEKSTEGKGIDPATSYRDGSGRVHTGSFRSFGGGFNVCPGRHFAEAEVQGIAALFCAAFDMHGEGGEAFIAPPVEKANGFLFTAAVKPAHDVQVRLGRRKGYEDVHWTLTL
ncbi:Cytochrome P450 monooxygenase [Pseudocercospora fuligena]|uniref:Cytochrome P450 monooxygenase n=1 Tax=Pseudocercospora fuligena TaxID=685502 RepID=A0A8H6VEK0_9PEZI|nr:Cytochrome P450 monooxygenase [Pseudocercospora fuligena]